LLEPTGEAFFMAMDHGVLQPVWRASGCVCTSIAEPIDAPKCGDLICEVTLEACYPWSYPQNSNRAYGHLLSALLNRLR
jgi:hypothetical protein